MSANITIIGNLVGDPDLSVSPTGKSYVNFGVAHTPVRPDGTKGETSFYNVTAWEYLAENFATSFSKGDRVVVMARVKQDRWEKDGEKRSKYSMIAEEIGASIRFATVDVTRNAKKVQDEEGTVTEVSDDDLFAN